MAVVDLIMPKLGESIMEATILKWHKQPGEAFSAGEPLYDIETEKVNQEVAAPGNGTLLEILVPEGENAKVNGAVCTVELAPRA